MNKLLDFTLQNSKFTERSQTVRSKAESRVSYFWLKCQGAHTSGLMTGSGGQYFGHYKNLTLIIMFHTIFIYATMLNQFIDLVLESFKKNEAVTYCQS